VAKIQGSVQVEKVTAFSPSFTFFMPGPVRRHLGQNAFYSLSFPFVALAMDDHPEHTQAPPRNSTPTRNLIDDPENSHPTSPFDKGRQGQNNDPRAIFNALYPTSVGRRGRSIDESRGDGIDYDPVS
jgi:hypothetical protein